MLKNKSQTLKYIISDYIAAMLAWILFYYYRKYIIEYPIFGEIDFGLNIRLLIGAAVIPLLWILFYYLSGQYRDPYYRSRLQELGQTITTTLIGSTILFFVVILDDYIGSYKDYYTSYFILISIHFTATYFPRLFITANMIKRLRSGKIGFNTIFIGGGTKTLDFYNTITSKYRSSGHIIKGFVAIHENSTYQAVEKLQKLGYLKDIRKIIIDNNIHEVIIASESREQQSIEQIIAKVEFMDVKIRLIPDMYNILTGRHVTSSLYGSPLLEISHELLPAWQENTKRFIDVAGSLIAIVVGIPLYICMAIGVKLSSKGPILYSHERIGKFGKPFKIYKFRSMVVDAEKNGPALSSETDTRVTPFGRFMRKSRLDEIPQFFNVLVGDMSLVGPRPERQFFIEQIVLKAPLYKHLLRVRPGITSWGQVKYGYAENVDQMVERLRYDLIYIESMSIYFDIKIMIYTIKTVFEGSGK
ncbi:MAG: sugar transferase [Salinivirgaceae bacterium]|nr:sugar transferase [Salinivirgaceae bacterium]MDD4746413.1 sugar transferase [Salinivirgaceae bacterium]MDY0279706.1 sugar transferase [Salinivirgaceae bacterium]